MSLLTQASLVLTPNAVKASKLYSIIPSNGNGDMTVVRGTTATRVNSSGLIESVAANVPRLNYDSVGGCPSILVEPQRTNLLLRSEEFENASWVKQGVSVISNSTTSPDGTIDADTITSTTTGQARVEQSLAVPTINTTYAFSTYAKAASSPFVALTRFSGVFFATFNLSSGTIINQSAGVNATIISVGNGWYRISFIINALTTDTASVWKIHPCTSTDPFSSVVGNSIYLWGAQLEVGAYPTSYIPTITATTRNADIISKTGISDLIGQTEGTLFAEFALNTSVNFQMDVRLTAGTGNEIIIFNTGLRPTVNISSANVLIFSTGNALDNTSLEANNKIAVAYKNNDFAIYQNGVLKFSQSTGNIPLSLPDLLLSNGSRSYLLKNTMLFKTRLTNTELAQLTTL